MEIVLEHLREYYVLYIITLICLLPVIYVTRKYSVPAVLYTVELSIYLGLMHSAMCGLVAITRWFRESTSMDVLDASGRPIDRPDWSTPWLEFWNLEAYNPSWVVWIEVVLAFIILLLMIRYRPMAIQRAKKKRNFKNEGGAPAYGKPGYRGAPGAKPGASHYGKGSAGRRGRR